MSPPLIGRSLPVTGGKLRKGWLARIIDGEVVSRFYFQFNPTQKVRNKTVNYTYVSPPGSPLPSVVFGSVNGDTISLTQLLDATTNYDDSRQGTLAQQAALESYVQPDISKFINSPSQFVSPPVVMLGFGGPPLRVVVNSINITDTRFNSDLVPTRSYVDMDMTAIFSSFAIYEARLQSLAILERLVTHIEPAGENY